MAITVTDCRTAASTSNLTTFTTSTVTPANGTDPILLLSVTSGSTARTVSAVTVGGSGSGGAAALGMTWSTVLSVALVDSGTAYRAQIWKVIGANTGAATIDITMSGATTGLGYSFLQFVGGHLTVPVAQSHSASSGTDTPGTTATVDVTNVPASTSCMVGLVLTLTATATGGTNMTSTFTTNYSSPSTRLLAGYNATPVSKTVSATFASNSWGICAAEVAAASTGDTSVVGMIPI